MKNQQSGMFNRRPPGTGFNTERQQDEKEDIHNSLLKSNFLKRKLAQNLSKGKKNEKLDEIDT